MLSHYPAHITTYSDTKHKNDTQTNSSLHSTLRTWSCAKCEKFINHKFQNIQPNPVNSTAMQLQAENDEQMQGVESDEMVGEK